MIIKAIVASTFGTKRDFDSRRTPYIFTEESIDEMNRQFNVAHESGSPIRLLIHTPQYKKDFDDWVGEVVESHVETDEDHDCRQCVVAVYINDEEIGKKMVENKREICFIPFLIPERRLRDAAVINEEDSVQFVEPPFRLLGMNVGTKRSSSNPYLTLL